MVCLNDGQRRRIARALDCGNGKPYVSRPSGLITDWQQTGCDEKWNTDNKTTSRRRLDIFLSFSRGHCEWIANDTRFARSFVQSSQHGALNDDDDDDFCSAVLFHTNNNYNTHVDYYWLALLLALQFSTYTSGYWWELRRDCDNCLSSVPSSTTLCFV